MRRFRFGIHTATVDACFDEKAGLRSSNAKDHPAAQLVPVDATQPGHRPRRSGHIDADDPAAQTRCAGAAMYTKTCVL